MIHKDYPHLGASPDGYIKYLCCGHGVLEVLILVRIKHFFKLQVTVISV